jgi:hypothetical protein
MTNARAEIVASDAVLPAREPRDAPSRREDQPRREDPPRREALPRREDPLRREAESMVEERIVRATPPSDRDVVREQPRADAGFVRPEGRTPGPGPTHQAPYRPAPVPTSEPADQVAPAALDRGATAPQLRRFIKSRAYVPIHELRRRFGLNGDDDDVTPVDIDRTRVFVGLPDREGRLLGELLRAGDIGYELSMDPVSPIVVGVYPMRPVTRN